MHRNRAGHPFLVLSALILLVTLSCGRNTPLTPPNETLATPGSSIGLGHSALSVPSSEFYPLTIGNHWHYGRNLTFQYAPDVNPADTIHSEIDRDLIGSEVLFDREYILEQETTVQDSRPGEIFRYWTRYRQDPSGLYYADICACDTPNADGAASVARVSSEAGALNANVPASSTPELLAAYDAVQQRLGLLRRAALGARIQDTRKPGGALSNEVTLLKYPLRPGSSWVLREGFVYTVEALETLDLPIGRQLGYRIRVDFGSNPDPNSSIYVWFGRAGMLGYRIWYRQIGGYPTYYFEVVEAQWLEDVSLIRQ